MIRKTRSGQVYSRTKGKRQEFIPMPSQPTRIFPMRTFNSIPVPTNTPSGPSSYPPIIHLTALRRTLAAISAALATLFAHETTAQCRQTSLPLAKVQSSSIWCPLTKLPSILCPSSALAVVVVPVGIVLAEDRSTSAVVVVERRIVGVGRSRRLGDRSCDEVSTCSLFDYVVIFCDRRRNWVCARLCAIAPVLIDGRGKRTFVVGTEAEARLGSSLGSTC